MANKVGIFNLSPRCGKTVTSAFLAAALTAVGKKVVTLDLSGDLTRFLDKKTNFDKGGLIWENVFLGETKFDSFLEAYNPQADFILVDFPSENGYVNYLDYVDAVIIPIEAEFYGLETLNRTLEVISEKGDVVILGFLLTQCNPNSDFSDYISKSLNEYFGSFVLESKISRNYYLALPEFTTKDLNQNVLHSGFSDYLGLANEIVDYEY